MARRLIEMPPPRGPLSEQLFEALQARPDKGLEEPDPIDCIDPIADDDLQLALYIAYELHYTAIDGIDERWEWAPALLSFRAALERPFEEAVAELVAPAEAAELESVGAALQAIVADDPGPPLSRYMETQGTHEQMLEHVVHRSAYQLKEADPHSWAIPRLEGPAKAALVEVQADEYGGGRPDRVHAVLFAKAMAALDLDPAYGAYLDRIPAVTLATVNQMSLFGLNRRLRGAIVGHLAAFETTSPIPNGRYAKGLRRLGLGGDALDFFDEHVVADSVHENIAVYDMAQGLALREPALAGDILFGVRALLDLEFRWAGHLLASWEDGASSLLEPLASAR